MGTNPHTYPLCETVEVGGCLNEELRGGGCLALLMHCIEEARIAHAYLLEYHVT